MQGDVSDTFQAGAEARAQLPLNENERGYAEGSSVELSAFGRLQMFDQIALQGGLSWRNESARDGYDTKMPNPASNSPYYFCRP